MAIDNTHVLFVFHKVEPYPDTGLNNWWMWDSLVTGEWNVFREPLLLSKTKFPFAVANTIKAKEDCILKL